MPPIPIIGPLPLRGLKKWDKAEIIPIDRLVIRRLQAKGLSMSERAPLSVLCRRIYLDLVGLPPSPEELADFVSAGQLDFRDGVDALIDRLLGSKHFGEKWAATLART